MLKAVVFSVLVVLATADDPIVHLFGRCPPTDLSSPSIHLTADVPAYALAICRNGDKQLTSTDEVNFSLGGAFDQSFVGTRCLFYKKSGSNTYTVDVEVGWGEPSSQVVLQRRIHTISCSYDDHGKAISAEETISDWFLNPWEQQHLMGGNASAVFALQLWDVLDKEITTDHISIGRKIRLVAFDSTSTYPSFRALSCQVRNSFGRYYILRAGCGDGLVYTKTSGFLTEGNTVYSPYFDTFKLNGEDDTVQFECIFTVCNGLCNGNSCQTLDVRRRRSLPDASQPYVLARSGPIRIEG